MASWELPIRPVPATSMVLASRKGVPPELAMGCLKPAFLSPPKSCPHSDALGYGLAWQDSPCSTAMRASRPPPIFPHARMQSSFEARTHVAAQPGAHVVAVHYQNGEVRGRAAFLSSVNDPGPEGIGYSVLSVFRTLIRAPASGGIGRCRDR